MYPCGIREEVAERKAGGMNPPLQRHKKEKPG
jgi:hypothetical protein